MFMLYAWTVWLSWWVFKVDALSSSHSLGDSYSQCREVFVGDFISQCIKQLYFHWLSSSYPLIPTMTAPAQSAGQLSQVITSVKDCLRDEMQSLKREVSQEREAADDRLVKRMKMEKGPTFKKTNSMLPSSIGWRRQLQHCNRLHRQWKRPRQA